MLLLLSRTRRLESYTIWVIAPQSSSHLSIKTFTRGWGWISVAAVGHGRRLGLVLFLFLRKKSVGGTAKTIQLAKKACGTGTNSLGSSTLIVTGISGTYHCILLVRSRNEQRDSSDLASLRANGTRWRWENGVTRTRRRTRETTQRTTRFDSTSSMSSSSIHSQPDNNELNHKIRPEDYCSYIKTCLCGSSSANNTPRHGTGGAGRFTSSWITELIDSWSRRETLLAFLVVLWLRQRGSMLRRFYESVQWQTTDIPTRDPFVFGR